MQAAQVQGSQLASGLPAVMHTWYLDYCRHPRSRREVQRTDRDNSLWLGPGSRSMTLRKVWLAIDSSLSGLPMVICRWVFAGQLCR